MYGANVGLEIGKRALLAQQLSLNITGHNIANVNTPGFSRQSAIMESNMPMVLPFGSLGTGVDVGDIRRIRSLFLDQQFRSESHKLGKWRFLNQTWSQVESIYNEPEDTGLSALLDSFWNSWQDLANNPESESARVAVREQASLLVNSFHHLSTQLRDLRESLDADINTMVLQVNATAAQIADLNQSIVSAELTGNTANDLRDRRDYLVDQLSQWVNVGVLEQSDGSYTVLLGGMALVDGSSSLQIATETQSGGTSVTTRVFFQGTGIEVEHSGGEFEGILEARDTIVVERQAEMDLLATELVAAVNEVHRAGYGLGGDTGIDFFDPDTTGAADIELNPQILEDVNYIAASLNGEIGDNSNALDMAALREALKLQNGQATFNEYYASVIGKIGIKSQEAQNLEQNQMALMFQIENARQSTSGVSLDEEMANMIRYQHAFEAAARVISAMDSALDTIINRMVSFTS
jgi:flagellar hook-associated protein 1 FlgK